MLWYLFYQSKTNNRKTKKKKIGTTLPCAHRRGPLTCSRPSPAASSCLLPPRRPKQLGGEPSAVDATEELLEPPLLSAGARQLAQKPRSLPPPLALSPRPLSLVFARTRSPAGARHRRTRGHRAPLVAASCPEAPPASTSSSRATNRGQETLEEPPASSSSPRPPYAIAGIRRRLASFDFLELVSATRVSMRSIPLNLPLESVPESRFAMVQSTAVAAPSSSARFRLPPDLPGSMARSGRARASSQCPPLLLPWPESPLRRGAAASSDAGVKPPVIR